VHSNPTIIVAIVVVIAAIVIVALLLARRNKALALQRRFGKEYERTVTERGSEREAQAILEQRQKRVAHFNIRKLSPAERDRYAEAWRRVQSRFVDDPKGAVIEADDTVISVMREEGYPMSDFAQRTADLSVDYPNVVQNYRAAHEIAVRHREGRATTEDLRQAMIYYRSLFEELLNGRKPDGVREVA
jgi:FtsZ-interacting cell division protein ZipA